MTLWHYDTMTLWHYDTMTPWHYDTGTLWHYDPMTPWHLLGFSVSVRLSSGERESPPVTRSWRRLSEARRIMVREEREVNLAVSSLMFNVTLWLWQLSRSPGQTLSRCGHSHSFSSLYSQVAAKAVSVLLSGNIISFKDISLRYKILTLLNYKIIFDRIRIYLLFIYWGLALPLEFVNLSHCCFVVINHN